MTDILDGTVAESKAAGSPKRNARRLPAAGKAGKARKGAIEPEPGGYVATAEGAERIHKHQDVFYEEGERVEGDPEALESLLSRGLVRRV